MDAGRGLNNRLVRVVIESKEDVRERSRGIDNSLKNWLVREKERRRDYVPLHGYSIPRLSDCL